MVTKTKGNDSGGKASGMKGRDGDQVRVGIGSGAKDDVQMQAEARYRGVQAGAEEDLFAANDGQLDTPPLEGGSLGHRAGAGHGTRHEAPEAGGLQGRDVDDRLAGESS